MVWNLDQGGETWDLNDGDNAGIANFQTCQLVVGEEKVLQVRKLAKFGWYGTCTREEMWGLKRVATSIANLQTCQLVAVEVESLQVQKQAKLRWN